MGIRKPCQSRWLGMSQATGGNLQLLFCLNAHVQLPSKYIRLSSWISVALGLGQRSFLLAMGSS